MKHNYWTDRYYYRQELLNERSWSPWMVKKLLGNPDFVDYSITGWYSYAYYYEKERVEKAEQDPEWERLWHSYFDKYVSK